MSDGNKAQYQDAWPLGAPPMAWDIWEQKYRLIQDGVPVDADVDATFWRVANAAASAEPSADEQAAWAKSFHEALSGFAFLPAGRILAGAGAQRNVTLFNCFVLGTIADDLGSIFEQVKEAALTMQAGGGIGHDFSTLRPRGATVRGVAATASGPVSFMDVWDAMCRTLLSAGQRRGAMMATLRCDHPDIEEFIASKSNPARLRNFNLSVLVTDAFIAAIRADADWPLVFGAKTYRTVRARALWHTIARSNYDYAEPGVIFIDRVNSANNLAYCETISATNPCGEQPLPPYGACLLGSINLAQLVTNPFTPAAALDTGRLQATVETAVRLLDNMIDVSRYPLPEQEREAKAKRRIGLGITGLADALIFLGLPYASPEARRIASLTMQQIQNAAYRASARLAAEKGPFPLYDESAILARPNIRHLDAATRELIARHGLRNGCLTSIAPTGTISIFAGNVSSGIEPAFDFRYRRRIKQDDGTREEIVEDFAAALYRHHTGKDPEGPEWVTAASLTPRAHLEMQAALQPHVDSAISKTINCPADIAPDAFENLYLEAYELGLKGCTLYRPNAITGSVLSSLSEGPTHEGPAQQTQPQAQPAAKPQPQKPAIPHSAAPLSKPPHAVGSPSSPASEVVYMTEPLARDAVLPGHTYKLKWPGTDHAYYITINDLVRDGRRRPFEIFINTKDLTHYAWTVALTRMISAVFRRGGDVSFIAEELRAIFDPQGGYWVGGKYVPSLLAAIGGIIETHLANLNAPSGNLALAPAQSKAAEGSLHATSAADVASFGTSPGSAILGTTSSPAASAMAGAAPSSFTTGPQVLDAGIAIPKLCPRCSQPDFRMEGLCPVCLNCGYSTCG